MMLAIPVELCEVQHSTISFAQRMLESSVAKPPSGSLIMGCFQLSDRAVNCMPMGYRA